MGSKPRRGGGGGGGGGLLTDVLMDGANDALKRFLRTTVGLWVPRTTDDSDTIQAAQPGLGGGVKLVGAHSIGNAPITTNGNGSFSLRAGSIGGRTGFPITRGPSVRTTSPIHYQDFTCAMVFSGNATIPTGNKGVLGCSNPGSSVGRAELYYNHDFQGPFPGLAILEGSSTLRAKAVFPDSGTWADFFPEDTPKLIAYGRKGNLWKIVINGVLFSSETANPNTDISASFGLGTTGAFPGEYEAFGFFGAGPDEDALLNWYNNGDFRSIAA